MAATSTFRPTALNATCFIRRASPQKKRRRTKPRICSRANSSGFQLSASTTACAACSAATSIAGPIRSDVRSTSGFALISSPSRRQSLSGSFRQRSQYWNFQTRKHFFRGAQRRIEIIGRKCRASPGSHTPNKSHEHHQSGRPYRKGGDNGFFRNRHIDDSTLVECIPHACFLAFFHIEKVIFLGGLLAARKIVLHDRILAKLTSQRSIIRQLRRGRCLFPFQALFLDFGLLQFRLRPFIVHVLVGSFVPDRSEFLIRD